MQTQNTLLIIDDEPAAREALEALLAAGGYQLEFASDGPQGLMRAAGLLPDLILLDVMMPGMDGFEVCRRLRADAVLAEVPVVMITALDDQASRLRGLEAGADDFISKPFDKAELRVRVRSICRLNRYRLLLAERIRFQWLIEQSQEGYVVLGPADDIRYANPQAQIYLGLADEAGGQNFLEVARRQYRCEPEIAWQQWAAKTLPAGPYYLMRPETPTARAFWLQVNELQLPPDLGSKRVMCLRNVTEVITATCDMRRFQTTLMHKLRTPVSSLYLSLTFLAEAPPQTPPAEAADLIATALKNTKRLNEELADIFQYIAAPTLAHIGQQVRLADLPAQIAALADKLQLPAVRIRVAESLQTKCLTISTVALDSIVWEILENAKKFHPHQTPQVEVEVAPAAQVPQAIQVQIGDDGVSLSPEQIQWALTPYVQSEKFFTGEAHGMGLGLPLVSTLVWQVGGQVRLANRLDRAGVLVELTLPLAEE